MPSFEETGPRNPVNESIRVDKASPRARFFRGVRAALVILATLIMLIPVFVMGITAFKSRSDVVSVPPKLLFEPTLEGFVFLFTERSQLTQAALAEARANEDELGFIDRIALNAGQQINGPSDFSRRLLNSLIIAGGSTIISVTLGLFAAYAFSRFEIAGKGDLLFFILSTRMLPAVVVAVPLFLLFREVGLHDSYPGMILLYTVFNLSLTTWLLKGFIDEIPKEYEEAAMVDGYSRWQSFYKIVLPQATTGIAATTVFAMIFSWNEYAFALLLTSENARTAPPAIATMLGRGGIEWSAIAAGTLAFLIPVIIIAFALRKYLLRGVTFGAIRQ
jgi:multiple sugar transport system permease protein